MENSFLLENSVISRFEKKVSDFFAQNHISLVSEKILCAGVSGGADSISLLVSLAHLSKKIGFSLKVISVNHKIRADEETDGDVLFTKEFCNSLVEKGFDVFFEEKVFERGYVAAVEQQRNAGIEEAARFLRYKAFEEFTLRMKGNYFCTAHNKNDQTETLLMRFLQGSKTGSGGIKSCRGIFLRPLIDISRAEIEEYLKIQNISWRTDKTNFDTDFFRNKIRNKLIPFLNQEFYGWEKAVLSNGNKISEDEEFFSFLVRDFFETGMAKKLEDEVVLINGKSFLQLSKSVQIRVLFEVFNLLKIEKRVPYPVVEETLEIIENNLEKIRNNSVNLCNANNYYFDFVFEKNTFSIKKHIKSRTESGFFAIIEGTGEYDFPFGKVQVLKQESGFSLIITAGENKVEIENLEIPVCIRNKQPGDEVKTSSGSYKSVSDVFSDWHVPVDKKNLLPLVQELNTPLQEIKYIPGSLFGFSDWLCKK